MTIKEFAQLCACSPQTLRYYDKIGLLKPVKVDPWSGYRYYEPRQALDFVKIKNLQAADFTIGQIKTLLTLPDQQVFEAFDKKIEEQIHKLERIREIQKTYLAEKITMEQIVYSMTDYILSQCGHPEILPEFGLTLSDAPAVLERLRCYMNDIQAMDLSKGDIAMTVNDEVIRGNQAILERIHSLTKENLEDTILLNSEYGHYTQSTADPEPDFSGYETIMELHGWEHVSDFIDTIPRLEKGNTYCLWASAATAAFFDDLSFPMFLMGAVLYKQELSDTAVNCAVSASGDGVNHFRLLRKKQAF